MLSRESLESYRCMTTSQRLALTLQMMRENTPHLLHGSADIVARRFERLRSENDAHNQHMLEAIARARVMP